MSSENGRKTVEINRTAFAATASHCAPASLSTSNPPNYKLIMFNEEFVIFDTNCIVFNAELHPVYHF